MLYSNIHTICPSANSAMSSGHMVTWREEGSACTEVLTYSKNWKSFRVDKEIMSVFSSSSQHRKHPTTKNYSTVWRRFHLHKHSAVHKPNTMCVCQMHLLKGSFYLNVYLSPLKTSVMKKKNFFFFLSFPLEIINTLTLPDAVDFRKGNHSKLLRRDRQYFH